MATKKKEDPTEVDSIAVEPKDHAYAVLTLNEQEFRLRPDQVHNLRRRLNAAFVELG